MRRGRFFSLALKDDRVEQCLRSCGSDFQTNTDGVQSKRKHENHDSCICIAGFSACGCQTEERSVRDRAESRHVAVQKGKQDQNHS